MEKVEKVTVSDVIVRFYIYENAFKFNPKKFKRSKPFGDLGQKSLIS